MAQKGRLSPSTTPYFAVFSRKINMLYWSDPELIFSKIVDGSIENSLACTTGVNW